MHLLIPIIVAVSSVNIDPCNQMIKCVDIHKYMCNCISITKPNKGKFNSMELDKGKLQEMVFIRCDKCVGW